MSTGEELLSNMAFVVFTKSMFPAIVLSLCDLILISSLKTQVPIHAPGGDTTAVDSADLSGLIIAYSNSVTGFSSCSKDINCEINFESKFPAEEEIMFVLIARIMRDKSVNSGV